LICKHACEDEDDVELIELQHPRGLQIKRNTYRLVFVEGNENVIKLANIMIPKSHISLERRSC
jgi:U3 small nucleolar RNA-associated protein 14